MSEIFNFKGTLISDNFVYKQYSNEAIKHLCHFPMNRVDIVVQLDIFLPIPIGYRAMIFVRNAEARSMFLLAGLFRGVKWGKPDNMRVVHLFKSGTKQIPPLESQTFTRLIQNFPDLELSKLHLLTSVIGLNVVITVLLQVMLVPPFPMLIALLKKKWK